MLEIEGLSAWYGEARVLGDVSLSVSAGEVVTLVGRNGAGKTTLLRSVMGLHRQTEGVLRFAGAEINRTSPDSRAKAGLGWVPDDRGIYASLTVLENLLLPPVVHPDAWSLDQIFQAFPVLADRRSSMGTQLSGGEHLLLDEPSEGLAPVIVQRIGEIVREIKAAGVAILLVEQNVKFAATVADRHYLLAQGRVVESLDNESFQARESELLTYLGI